MFNFICTSISLVINVFLVLFWVIHQWIHHFYSLFSGEYHGLSISPVAIGSPLLLLRLLVLVSVIFGVINFPVIGCCFPVRDLRSITDVCSSGLWPNRVFRVSLQPWAPPYLFFSDRLKNKETKMLWNGWSMVRSCRIYHLKENYRVWCIPCWLLRKSITAYHWSPIWRFSKPALWCQYNFIMERRISSNKVFGDVFTTKQIEDMALLVSKQKNFNAINSFNKACYLLQRDCLGWIAK